MPPEACQFDRACHPFRVDQVVQAKAFPDCDLGAFDMMGRQTGIGSPTRQANRVSFRIDDEPVPLVAGAYPTDVADVVVERGEARV